MACDLADAPDRRFRGKQIQNLQGAAHRRCADATISFRHRSSMWNKYVALLPGRGLTVAGTPRLFFIGKGTLTTQPSIREIFDARSVAVVGASSRAGNLATRIVQNLITLGIRGTST